ncbi:restriction endonuclease subunit S [Roseovarius pacificus]|uniref:restriction endonuclease subunit S n=1 Tax=Roseovarius pacificus TaxID=337701 RepID=UPI002A18DAAE|nr:restriction endonuclease subunit S [Roseovarius pacificus]
MRDVPRSGWKIKKLGEISVIASGGTPLKSTAEFWGGDIPWYSSGELSGNFTCEPKEKITVCGLEGSNAKLFPKGSLLIGMYDTAAMKMALLDRDAAFNQAVAGIKPKQGIDLRYVKAALEAIKPSILEQRRGTRQKNLSLAKIKGIEIPLPPLEDQRRIVAVLDEAFAGLDRARANAEANLADARELFENVLEAELERSTTASASTLGDHVDLLVGPAFKSKNFLTDGSGMRLMRGDNIVPGGTRWESFKSWPADDCGAYNRYLLAEDDVLIAMDRTWIKSGIKFAVLQAEDVPCLLVQRVARLRPKPTLQTGFLAALIGSKMFEKYVLSIQTGTGVPHISGGQINAFPIKLPKLDEQDRIVSLLHGLREETDLLARRYESAVSDLEDLRQSLLQKAFSGGLL